MASTAPGIALLQQEPPLTKETTIAPTTENIPNCNTLYNLNRIVCGSLVDCSPCWFCMLALVCDSGHAESNMALVYAVSCEMEVSVVEQRIAELGGVYSCLTNGPPTTTASTTLGMPLLQQEPQHTEGSTIARQQEENAGLR